MNRKVSGIVISVLRLEQGIHTDLSVNAHWKGECNVEWEFREPRLPSASAAEIPAAIFVLPNQVRGEDDTVS